MGFIDRIKNLPGKIADSIAVKKAFENDKRSLEVRILKENKPSSKAICDVENKKFYFLKEKAVLNVGDIIVDIRNQHYQVQSVIQNASISIVVDDKLTSIDVIEVGYIIYSDAFSLFDQINNQNLSIKQEINVTIQSMSNSQVGDIGSIVLKQINKQNVLDYWPKLKHDLLWRYEYKEHTQFIDNVDEAIDAKDCKILNPKLKEKTCKLVGAALGEFVSTIFINLIEYLKSH